MQGGEERSIGRTRIRLAGDLGILCDSKRVPARGQHPREQFPGQNRGSAAAEEHA